METTGGKATAGKVMAGKAKGGASPLVRGVDWLMERLERMRERRALAALDDRILHDLGITRAQADNEAGKPFWRE